jgi:manganese/zinc/iron transport system substrate-binding protein
MTARHLAAAFAAALAGLTVAGAPACRPPGERRSAGGPLRIVATTSLVADLVRNVGGEHVAVTALMGPGIDPHLYRARESDVQRLADADLVFYNGLHLEAKLGDVLERMTGRIPTAAVTGGIPRERLLAPPEFAGAHDPHVWFDVSLWSAAAAEVGAVLARREPARAEAYADGAARYRQELAALHEWVLAQAARVPESRRVLITAHDAFNYFGRAYGFEVRGLQGISTAAEAGTADVQALARFVAERRIPALFVESSVPPRTIEAVQAAVRARGFAVGIGGTLYSDALGTPGAPAGTYVGMVRTNVDTIVTALLGEESKDGEPR